MQQRWHRYIDSAKRQHDKDILFIDNIIYYFSGKILEIGAGVGQLSKIIQNKGYDVLASDIDENCVNYMKQHNINAIVIDALEIIKNKQVKFDTIFAQAIDALTYRDFVMIKKCYESIYQALNHGGIFIYINPISDTKTRSRVREHEKIYHQVGFRCIKSIRHQILPSILYNCKYPLLYNLLEKTLGRFVGLREVLILKKA
jgi:2-polyprenyl-3-methyl-5-hydroxy-6-metoxy-1,4-benzoquinol methylase